MDELTEAMRPFRREFVERSHRRLDDMEAALARLVLGAGGEDDAVAFETLRKNFHGLAGAGGSYGFPGVTSLAEEGEAACHGTAADKRSPAPTEVAHWGDLVARLRRRLVEEDGESPVA